MKKAVNTFLHEGGWLRALPFVMLFVYLLVIFQTVHIMWDDYSFASLSLFNDALPNVHGLYQLDGARIVSYFCK